MTRAGSQPRLLYTRDRRRSFSGIWLLVCSSGVQGLASSVLESRDGCSLRADVGSLALTLDGRAVGLSCLHAGRETNASPFVMSSAGIRR